MQKWIKIQTLRLFLKYLRKYHTIIDELDTQLSAYKIPEERIKILSE
jgi:hypothetical protein